MIKIVQISTRMGETILRVQADFPDQTVRTVEIDYSEIEDRVRKVGELLGRKPIDHDFVDVVKAIVNEMRFKGKPLEKRFPFEGLIDVDLEGSV